MEEAEILLGRYRIDRLLGTGGMGRVVAATDLRIQQPVALKLLTPERTRDAEAVARMIREADAASRLSGPHTGRILDVCRTDAGEPILVMELLDGEDLARMLARVGRVPDAEAIALVLEACEGLAEAHAIGLVHRDIKPSNLFAARDIDGSNLIKVIDFGVVKFDASQVEGLTKTTSMIGSVAYMAPEQLRKLPVDARADVWSLGVVLYELVSGRRPFPAETITDASIRIAVETPEPLPPEVSTSLAAVIARCLEKDPVARYRDVGELASALASCSHGHDDRAMRIRRMLGDPTDRVEPQVIRPARTLAIRCRDGLATHWLSISLGVMLWSLALLLLSFAVNDHLNELTIGNKRTGYLSSFNWTLVHTFLCPITIAVIGMLLRATTNTIGGLGAHARAAWNRRARHIAILGVVTCSILGVGYTAIEWSFVTTGRCDSGTFLGWPNQLCAETGGDVGSVTFMVLAAIAQAVMLCASWLLLSIVIWMCDLFFGTRRIQLGDAAYPKIGALFGIAMWGWAALFVALYLARLWSVHLRMPTAGVIETIFEGPLFAIDAHTQTDWGSMIAGVIMLAAASAPFAFLRSRLGTNHPHTLERVVATLGVVGLVSMIFPRLGFFLLPTLGIVAITVAPVRRALRATWPVSD